jgi:hypothetical protein
MFDLKFYEDLDSRLNVEKYDDFHLMVKDIKGYCKNNNCHVIPHDFPLELSLGFLDYDSGKCWKIELLNFKKYCNIIKNSEDINDNIRANLLTRAFSSIEGKNNFCGMLCKKDINRFVEELKEKYPEDN